MRTSEALLRFCLSCAVSLGFWSVWLGLGMALGAQLYLLGVNELPVPGFVRRHLEEVVEAEGLVLSFGRAQFDPGGRLLLQDANLRIAQVEEPVLEAESILLRKNPWSVLSGARAPDEIRIHRAAIRLPASLSPSGAGEPLFRDLQAALRLDGNLIRVDQLSFRFGTLDVMVQGEFTAPSHGGERAAVGIVVGHLLRDARDWVRVLPHLECLDRPSLFVTLTSRPGVGNAADLRFSALGASRPFGVPVEIGLLDGRTSIRLDTETGQPVRVSLSASKLDVEGGWSATGIVARLSLPLVPRTLSLPNEAIAELAARSVSGLGETAGAPSGAIRWGTLEGLEARIAAEMHGSVLVASARGDPVGLEGRLGLAGDVPPALVGALLDPRAPRLAPYLRFRDPVRVQGEASFARGGSFSRLTARVRGRGWDANNVPVSAFRGTVETDAAGDFLVHRARIAAAGSHASGSYAMNFRSLDYRMLLSGILNPPLINPLFRSGWWGELWEKLRFPDAAPSADVDIQGNWRIPAQTTYFGWTAAGATSVLGADFESAHARVFARPHFAHAFDLDGTRARGSERAGGWFKRRADPSTRELRSLEYDLQGRLSPETLALLGGATAERLLAPWKFSAPPEIAFQGRTRYGDGLIIPELSFRGSASGPLAYLGFPLGGVVAAGSVNGNEVLLERIEVEAAGGRGAGKASLGGVGPARRLGFDFYLQEADLVKCIGALRAYESFRAPAEATSSPNAALLHRASGGRLNFAVSAQGHPDEMTSFTGSGNLEVSGAELGEIHLFGLLSEVLSGLSLRFSSLKLDSLRGSFRLGNGRAHFDDIRVTGPSALIEGKGDFQPLGRSLNFSARFKPYEENLNLITGMIGIVVNPLASILELNLTGTLSRPKWTVSITGGSPAQPPND